MTINIIMPYMTTQNIFIIGAAILLLMMLGFDRVIMLIALCVAVYFAWPYINVIPTWIIGLALLLTAMRITLEWAFENDRRLYRRRK